MKIKMIEYLVKKQEQLIESFHHKYLSINRSLSTDVFKFRFTLLEDASKQLVNLNICGRPFWVQITLFSKICTADTSSIAVSLIKYQSKTIVSRWIFKKNIKPFKKWTESNTSDGWITFNDFLSWCTRRWWKNTCMVNKLKDHLWKDLVFEMKKFLKSMTYELIKLIFSIDSNDEPSLCEKKTMEFVWFTLPLVLWNSKKRKNG